MIRFHVPGPVVGKGRPRVGKIGAHARMFTPAKTVAYESTVRLFAAQAMAGAPLMTGPVQVNLLVGVAIPKSMTKKDRKLVALGLKHPASKPDLDNCVKAAFDAMNGCVYRDDVQVTDCVVKKRYREEPGLWVQVFELGSDADAERPGRVYTPGMKPMPAEETFVDISVLRDVGIL